MFVHFMHMHTGNESQIHTNKTMKTRKIITLRFQYVNTNKNKLIKN